MTEGAFPGVKGLRVLIAGGSSGIGASAAEILARGGARVVIVGRNEDKCRRVIKALQGEGHYTLGDLTKPADCKRVVAQGIEKLGGLDTLINVGGGGGEELGESLEAYQAVYNANVISALALMEAAEEELIKSKGAFLNTSTICATIAMPNFTAYCVAKAGLDMLIKCWAVKYASKGVRVNSVLPGPIDTEPMRGMGEKMGMSADDFVKMVGSSTLLGKVGQPHHVGATFAFLASESAKNITGVTLPVDGGASLTSWATLQNKVS